MPTKAIFIGSIGVLCETSNMQRHAYNVAFKEAGLGWTWEARAYTTLVQRFPDPLDRLRHHAARMGDEIDATRVEERKSRIFRQMLARAPVRLRPGVADCLIGARRLGLLLALTSTEDVAEIEALVDATTPRISLSDFAFVGHRDSVSHPKPAADVFHMALSRLGLAPGDVMAVEDTIDGVQAAHAAGIPTIAFPNATQIGREFKGAHLVTDVLSPSRIGMTAEDGFSLSA